MSNDNTNNFGPETTIPVAPKEEEVLVPQIHGFLKTHDGVKGTMINPENGNTIHTYEQVPRGLAMVGDKIWEDPAYLATMLGLTVGSNVRTTQTGLQIRDIFFSKVQNPKNVNKKTGKPYAWLKVGQLFSKQSQDVETGEMKEVYWVNLGFKPWVKPETAPQIAQDGLSEDEVKKQVNDAVDNL